MKRIIKLKTDILEKNPDCRQAACLLQHRDDGDYGRYFLEILYTRTDCRNRKISHDF